MTLADLFKLIRHYAKLVVAIPLISAVIAAGAIFLLPPTYEAKATLLTNGDIALSSGFAQNEAATYSKNGIEVSSTTDTAYRTIVITATGKDYGGCIAAANATVAAAAEDCRSVNTQAAVTTNEATSASSTSPSVPKVVLMALLLGLFVSICVVVVIDLIKAPIKSQNDIELSSGLPVIGVIPSRDRGERLLANVRFLTEGELTTIAIVPIGLSGGVLTCAELSSAFERSGTIVSRVKGSPHAEGLNQPVLSGVLSLIECAPLNEGVGAVYIAKESDITILCVSEWRDSRKALSSVVEELKFAKANLEGVVFLTAGYSDNKAF